MITDSWILECVPVGKQPVVPVQGNSLLQGQDAEPSRWYQPHGSCLRCAGQEHPEGVWIILKEVHEHCWLLRSALLWFPICQTQI